MTRAAILAAVVATAVACGPNSVTITSTSPTTTSGASSSGATGSSTQPANPTPTHTPHPHPPEPPVPPTNEARVNGAVSALSGTCPALSFVVNNTNITTSSETRFDRGGCSAVANGVTVKVDGLKQSDGSIQARHVFLDKGAK